MDVYNTKPCSNASMSNCTKKYSHANMVLTTYTCALLYLIFMENFTATRPVGHGTAIAEVAQVAGMASPIVQPIKAGL